MFFFKDVDVDKPDEKSIMTYVSQFFKSYPEAGTVPKVKLAKHLIIKDNNVTY